MNLSGAVALVTGGTGGLGGEICRNLSAAGARIAFVYNRSEEKARGLAAELGGMDRALAIRADVTTQAGIDRMIGTAVEAWGRIDALVLDAAYNEWIAFADLEKLTEEKWKFILDFNLTAPYLAMRTVAPLMKKQGRGRIVSVSSIAAFQPSASSIAYAVSKAALVHLTKCMAVALAPEILVNCVAPGLMEGTRMTDNLAPEYAQASRDSALLKRAANKQDVAAAVKTLLVTDSITGQTLVVDAGKVFH